MARFADRKPLDRFVNSENIQRYLTLLRTETDQTKRSQLLKLLAEAQEVQEDFGGTS